MNLSPPACQRTQGPFDRTKQLDRRRWYRPLISIIITHYNYSAYIRDALLSVLDQTYENWECVVVDDCSNPPHRAAVQAIIDEIGSDKIRLLALPENGGQIPAFFAGLDATRGAFVCLLDPDDRYAESFLAEMLAAHLNDKVFCPVACCDQKLVQGDSIFSGVYTCHKLGFLSWRSSNSAEVPPETMERLLYFAPGARGWLWTSTSAMMFRRAALKLARPHKTLAYKRAADCYLAQGTHLLGGTLFVTKPLLYRGVHEANGWLNPDLFATVQENGRPQLKNYSLECLTDVIEAIHHNGGATHLERNGFVELAPGRSRAAAQM